MTKLSELALEAGLVSEEAVQLLRKQGRLAKGDEDGELRRVTVDGLVDLLDRLDDLLVSRCLEVREVELE